MAKIIRNTPEELRESYQRVLIWFYSFPTTGIGLTELSKVTKISKSTAQRIVRKMLKEQFIIKEVIGNSWSLRCNQHHMYNYTKKIAYNIESIYDSGIIASIERQFPNAKAIVLFGSYRKGDDTDKSDIDIAVELVGKDRITIVDGGKISLGYRKNIPVNLHIFNRENIDLNLFANIANGFVLEGFLEVKP